LVVVREHWPGPLASFGRADACISTGTQRDAPGSYTGDAAATERKLGEAADLVGQLAARPDQRRTYRLTPQLLECERGVALGYFAHDGRYRTQALAALTAGYAGLGADLARSEWTIDYLVHRAAVHMRGGDIDAACADAMRVVPVARRTGSASLTGMLAQLHAGLSVRYPDDPRVAELADALA
jgi:hypothetical protein